MDARFDHIDARLLALDGSLASVNARIDLVDRDVHSLIDREFGTETDT